MPASESTQCDVGSCNVERTSIEGTHPAIMAPVMRRASMPLTPHAAPAQPASRTQARVSRTAMQNTTRSPSTTFVRRRRVARHVCAPPRGVGVLLLPAGRAGGVTPPGGVLCCAAPLCAVSSPSAAAALAWALPLGVCQPLIRTDNLWAGTQQRASAHTALGGVVNDRKPEKEARRRTSLNCWLARDTASGPSPTWRSGWNLRAARRKAALTSSVVALRWRPSTAYGSPMPQRPPAGRARAVSGSGLAPHGDTRRRGGWQKLAV